LANIIELAGANRVICVDLHAEAIQGFFDIPVDALIRHSRSSPAAVRERHGHDDRLVVSPDTGGVNRARNPCAHPPTHRSPSSINGVREMTRWRSSTSSVTSKAPVCLIVDDLISTGGTLASAAVALLARGAQVGGCRRDPRVLSDGALARLHEAPIDEICITDTIPYHNGSHSFDDAPKLRILSVAR